MPVDSLYEIARLYASTDKAGIFYTLGITEHICGTRNVMACANLAMLTGHLGKPGTGVNPLRGQNNVQGACDMGALPNVYPGYQAVNNEELRRQIREGLGRASGRQGRTQDPRDVRQSQPGRSKGDVHHGREPGADRPEQQPYPFRAGRSWSS